MTERRLFKCGYPPVLLPSCYHTKRLFSAKLRGKGRPKKKRTAAGKIGSYTIPSIVEDALTILFRIRIPISKEEEIDVPPTVVN